MKSWYSIQNKHEGIVDIQILDELSTWGVSAADFSRELNAVKNVKTINVLINSPGGSVFDGLAIYNTLKNHSATVNTSVLGLAASAATLPFMAGDNRSMPEDAFLMIHNPLGTVAGESEDMRDYADTLDKVADSLVNLYSKNSDAENVREMMAQETWMTAQEALDMGFINNITDQMGIAAKSGKFERYFAKLPAQPTKKAIEEIKNIKDFERYLRDAGSMSKSAATALSSRAKSLFSQGDPEDGAEKKAEIYAALCRLETGLKPN